MTSSSSTKSTWPLTMASSLSPSLLRLIDSKPETLELILTGRNANPEILEKADLVTEMVERKHYYKRGIPARKGIEL